MIPILLKKRRFYEKDISAEQQKAKEQTWLQKANEHAVRTSHSEQKKGKGKKAHCRPVRMKTQTLRRNERLKKNSDFKTLFSDGVRVRGKHLSIQLFRKSGGDRQVAFIASRRVGNAVQRNKAKRLMREAYRTVKHVFPEKCDLAFMANSKILNCELAMLRDEIVRLFNRMYGQDNG